MFPNILSFHLQMHYRLECLEKNRPSMIHYMCPPEMAGRKKDEDSSNTTFHHHSNLSETWLKMLKISVALSLSECARETSETNEDIMEKYLTGMKRKAERDRDREIHKSHQCQYMCYAKQHWFQVAPMTVKRYRAGFEPTTNTAKCKIQNLNL